MSYFNDLQGFPYAAGSRAGAVRMPGRAPVAGATAADSELPARHARAVYEADANTLLYLNRLPVLHQRFGNRL